MNEVEQRSTTINHLKLSTRATNVLLAKNIKTIEQLTLLTRNDLLKIDDIGRTTLQDIETELAVLNLRLKEIPAFAKTPFIKVGTPQNGMTLRDYFAAKAMQPVVDDFLASGWSFANKDLSQFIAQQCYEIADAMMKARKL
jgi:hypothetical protein